MKVILTERVKALGNVGEIVNVSAGHARNFLLPNGFAVLADEGNKKALENQKRALNKKVEAQKNEANALKSKLDSVKLQLVKKVGASGRLFGTVTSSDLSKELEKLGYDVERRLILVDTPIKAIGNYKVRAKLFSGVEATFEVQVQMDPAQAEELKAKQAEAERKAAEKKARREAGEEAPVEAAAAEPTVEKTEEQKLKEEADKILRG